MASEIMPRWVNFWCMAMMNHPNDKMGAPQRPCNKRQFMTPSGETCENGHGGVIGVPMSDDELVAFNAPTPWKREEEVWVNVPNKHQLSERMIGYPDGRTGEMTHAIRDADPLTLELNEVKIGDTVRLTSGGPPMTASSVININKVSDYIEPKRHPFKEPERSKKPTELVDQHIECIWFTGDDVHGWTGPFRQTFSIFLLESVK